MCKRVMTSRKRELDDVLSLCPTPGMASTFLPPSTSHAFAAAVMAPALIKAVASVKSKHVTTPLSALGQDVLNVVAQYCHPIELARLGLCTRELLVGSEQSAALLCRRYVAPAEADMVAYQACHSNLGSCSGNSWCYRYLCAFEVAGVEAPKLKTVLRDIYSQRHVMQVNIGSVTAKRALAGSTGAARGVLTPTATQHLNLYGLRMGDGGAERLALALRVARAYRVLLLNLGGNDLSDRGAQAVIQAIKRHHAEVDTLFLAQNQIGPEGARCVADLISSSPTLRSLSLSDNPLTDEGAVCITGALPESSSLATLSMRCASFSSQAREGLRSSWGGRGGDKVFGLYI